MPEFSPEQYIAAMSMASLLLIMTAVVQAYRLGRDRGLGARSDRLDRLYSELNLHGTMWRVAGSDNPSDQQFSGTIVLTQHGSRLRAAGVDALHRPWDAEGIVFRREIHLLFVERGDRGNAVGSLHLKLDELGQILSGMSSTWHGDQSGGTIRTVTWQRSGETIDARSAVDFEKHGSATVEFPQQSSNLFRPVDTQVSELVTAGSSKDHNGFEPHNR